ncbi:hypothetical protein [Cytobacillus praedii]|uniref:hypothetical protein n=1 Tax=Cytobacillus praedii TaxID=1742358 RepID=UPI002E1D7124|nr:hypothetical protein [Cytobacillus praedii]
MTNKIVEFTLIREDAVFSQKQKDVIEIFLKTYDWDGFKDILSLKYMHIGDNYFIVKVDELNNTWHNRFSQLICDRAHLQNYRIANKSGNYRLFDPKEQMN